MMRFVKTARPKSAVIEQEVDHRMFEIIIHLYADFISISISISFFYPCSALLIICFSKTNLLTTLQQSANIHVSLRLLSLLSHASLALYPALNLHFLPSVSSLFLKGQVLQNPPFQTLQLKSQRERTSNLTAKKKKTNCPMGLSCLLRKLHCILKPTYICNVYAVNCSLFCVQVVTAFPSSPFGFNQSTYTRPQLSFILISVVILAKLDAIRFK